MSAFRRRVPSRHFVAVFTDVDCKIAAGAAVLATAAFCRSAGAQMVFSSPSGTESASVSGTYVTPYSQSGSGPTASSSVATSGTEPPPYSLPESATASANETYSYSSYAYEANGSANTDVSTGLYPLSANTSADFSIDFTVPTAQLLSMSGASSGGGTNGGNTPMIDIGLSFTLTENGTDTLYTYSRYDTNDNVQDGFPYGFITSVMLEPGNTYTADFSLTDNVKTDAGSQQTVFPAALNLSVPVVPEPASLGILVGNVWLLTRRRRTASR